MAKRNYKKTDEISPGFFFIVFCLQLIHLHEPLKSEHE